MHTDTFLENTREHIATLIRCEYLHLSVSEAAKYCIKSLATGHKLFICGNGGSAADAQHFAAELICKSQEYKRTLPCIALTTDTSVLIPISNDYDFNNIFAHQLEALMHPGDTFIGITTSGQSQNVIRAAQVAQIDFGNKAIILTGKHEVAYADVPICVPSDETARIQEVHSLVLHSIADIIENTFVSQDD